MSFFRRSPTRRLPPGQIAPDRMPLVNSEIEGETVRIAAELLAEARGQKAGVLSRQFWSDQLMEWSMGDPALKTQLFRFIDVFPALTSPAQVHEVLVDYLSQPGVRLPPALSMGMRAGSLMKGTLARSVATQVEAMGRKFIAGEDARAAMPILAQRWNDGLAASVDLLGEACVSDEEATAYQRQYIELIEVLAAEAATWPARPELESDHLGPIPRANVSIKITALCARVRPPDADGSLRRLFDAVAPVLTRAGQLGVTVNFDMEQFAMKELTIRLFRHCCERIDFPAGLAMQAYLTSGEDDARLLIDWARASGRQVSVRLIKGAYWDYETIHAELMGWRSPVWQTKRQTDACFERMARLLVDAIPMRADEGGIRLAVGSHNARSIAAALALVEARALPQAALEVQMLRGMADELKHAVVSRGLRLREYVPVGQMIPGMAYLVRRLLENTSNESWLRAGFADGVSQDQLLSSPHAKMSEPDGGGASLAMRHQLSAAPAGLDGAEPFFTEPMRDFSDAQQREHSSDAIAKGAEPGAWAKSPGIESVSVEVARAAVATAAGALAAWRDRPVVERARIIRAAAAGLRNRRDEICGLLIREGAKTWAEADGDVCEAIDFCEYYARQAVALMEPRRLGNFAGELDLHWHEPRGVAAIISPWNFPLSICTGMTVAALVTGNPVIVKPAEQTPRIAAVMCETLIGAGVPTEAIQFLPGPGETIGAALVRDGRVALIAFTGSREVGFDIIAAAGRTDPSQPFVKHVVCEMGGKNAIIVDDTADLDEAVLGVRQSAFSHSGQKCSACSRVIVLAAVHDVFLRRLIESARSLIVGDPMDPATDMGPLIDAAAAEKVRSYIEIGKSEGKLELAVDVPPALEVRIGKPFVGPHIFSGIRPGQRLAGEEIFGPVLSVMRAENFDEALSIANDVPFKLTGGVFSRMPAHLERARREFRVGDLYLNRAITGALVGRQPFGGFGWSGLGTQAGGPDYLLQFVVPRSCTENTLRRGFAPQ